MFSLNWYIRGFHAYKQNWHPVLARKHSRTIEKRKEHDEYAIAVVNDDEAVEHISLRLSKGGLGRFHLREVPLYVVGLYPNIPHD